MLWIAAVLLIALAGSPALALHEARFPEDVRRGNQRIVSGWQTNEGQIPHQLSLRMVNNIGAVSACGASLIHEDWAITAAHCTALRVTIVIRAGVVNLTRPEYITETTRYYNHPLYIDAMQSVVQPNDISLLALPRSIPFSANIQPIRMQHEVDRAVNYGGRTLVASGWGRTWTAPEGESPENMNWVYLMGESNEECRFIYGNSPIIVDSTICAGPYNVSSQSTCQGDSGGPLTFVDEDGLPTLIGVTSFVSGTGCHTPVPAGFIRPGYYHAWYRDVTGIDFDDWALVPQIPSTVGPPTTTTQVPQTVEPPTTTTQVPQTVEPPTTTTQVPQTVEPPTTTTQVPQTVEPPTTTTQVPQTVEPPTTTTQVPQTVEPPTTTTQVPQTVEPPTTTTQVPQTVEPPTTTTQVPQTVEPPTTTTQVPQTVEPPTTTTQVPQTVEPPTTTTQVPQTVEPPTTTTQVPQTVEPPTTTTQVPQTVEPPTTTTQVPQTVEPPTTTTQVPQTVEPPTIATQVPSTIGLP